MAPEHLFHESKELLSNIAGIESVKSLINTFIGLNIIINIVPPEPFLVKAELVCINPVTCILFLGYFIGIGPDVSPAVCMFHQGSSVMVANS